MQTWLRHFFAIMPVTVVAIFLLNQLPHTPSAFETLITQIEIPPNAINRTDKTAAEELCEAFAGTAAESVDCRTGLVLGSKKLSTETLRRDSAVYLSLIKRLTESEIAYTNLTEKISDDSPNAPSSVLRYRINRQIHALKEINSILQQRQFTDTLYRQLFESLLSLEGVRYSSTSGSFRRSSWHIARLLDDHERLQARGVKLNYLMDTVWIISLLSIIITNLLLISRFSLAGGIVGAIFSSISLFSVVIAANASLRFGGGASAFSFSPLSDQFQRQLIIMVGSHLVILTFVFGWRLLSSVVSKVNSNNLWLSLCVLLTAVLAYFALGPAAGSELLKLGVAFTAASAVVFNARESFLSEKYKLLRTGNENYSMSRARKIVDRTGHAARVVDPLLYLQRRLVFSVGLSVLASAVVLSIAAIIFSDLGGALIACTMLMSMILLAFGGKVGSASLVILVLAAFSALFTSKVQNRIELMLEPMNAKVSDFARLIEFRLSAQPNGYGIKNLPWCSDDGVCIPVQILSDYMPTLLSAMFGDEIMYVVFLIVSCLYILIALQTLRLLITARSALRLLAGIAFFLALGCLVQTVITFFGNWRLIPLTGLGMPLLSIGFSSSLATAVVIGISFSARAASLENQLK